MTGIAGMIGEGGFDEFQTELSRMVSCLAHVDASSSGSYSDQNLGLQIGWVNHRGSFSDCLPIWNVSRDVCLIFSGEDFSEVPQALSRTPVGKPSTAADARYLVGLYEEMGLDFVRMLNGWFSGVAVDLRTGTIALFNDRYGLGRIYHHQHGARFYFASEAKCLLKVLPHTRALDLDSLAETFSHGCVLENRTLFPSISLLPAGSLWTFRARRLATRAKYFRPEDWEQQPVADPQDHYDEFKSTFAHILPRYLRGTQPIGMSLTGGLDGRMIMAFADRGPGKLPCYTFVGMYKECADARIARRVASICSQPHQTIAVDPRFLADFPWLARDAIYLSDGNMDVTGSVELHVNRLAREIAPIRLTGSYGSEIVRGNVAFKPEPVDTALLSPEFASRVSAAPLKYAEANRGNPLSFIAFKQVPWHHYSRFVIEQSQLTLRLPYLDNDLVALMYRAPPASLHSAEPSLRLIAEGNPALAAIPTDRGLLHRPVPLLSAFDRLISQFTFKAEYAFDLGMPHWLAKLDRLSPLHLERPFLGRHKFFHFRGWYQGPLSSYLKEILLDPVSLARPYLRRTAIERMLRSHVAGTHNYTSALHKLLTAELIQRELIEQG
jgi:asparagine synthase (glutamine-hydrolysing)